MHGRDHSCQGAPLAAWNIIEEKLHQRYFPGTYLRLLTTSIQPVGQLGSAGL